MKLVSLILIVVSTIVIFLAGYPFDNFKVIGPDPNIEGVAEVLNKDKIVHPGEELKYKFTYHKHFNFPGEVSKEMTLSIDEGAYSLRFKPFMGSLPAGTHTIIASVKIPDTCFVVGKSKLIFNIKYPILGGLRILYDSYESEPFVIKER